MKIEKKSGLGATCRAMTKRTLRQLAGKSFCTLSVAAVVFCSVTATAAPSAMRPGDTTTESTDANTTTTETVFDFNAGTGTATAVTAGTGGVKVTAKKSVVIGSNYTNGRNYLKIAPASGKFKVNDKITLTGYSNKGDTQLYLYAKDAKSDDADPTPTLMYTTSAFGKSTDQSTYTYTVTSECDTIRIGRVSGSTTTLTQIKVERTTTSSEKTQMTASFAKSAGTYLTTATSADIPELTVKGGESTLASSAYNVTYASDNTGVFTVGSDNKLTFVAAGTATLTATVTPTDATKYEGCTATYQVTVKEPSELVVTVSDVTMNPVDAAAKQPTVVVYGDEDKVLKLGTDYTLKYEVAANGNATSVVTVSDDGVFSVAGSAYNWTLGSNKITVTATPTDANTYKAASATFTYTVFKGKLNTEFLSVYSGKTILLKTNAKKVLTIPTISDGEDISSYFTYTYNITTADNNKTAGKLKATGTKKKTYEVTLVPSKSGTYNVTVSASTTNEAYNNPADLTFTVKAIDDLAQANVSIHPTETTINVGQKLEGAELTVTDENKTPLDDDSYTATWYSFTPAIVKVNSTDGSLEGLSEGMGTVYVLVEGAAIETMIVPMTVNVDNPKMYRAKETEAYGNLRVMNNQDGTLSVRLGGWQFPNDVQTTTATTEGLKKEYAWADNAGDADWAIAGFHQMVAASSKQKNARQENGSNALPQSTGVYKIEGNKFSSVATVRDPMFNVPCSGSFLEFNPKTNGKVTVHIYQSGVFDYQGSNYVYRPQRRVFVMDEAGNFVSSKGTIENANGKPKADGGTALKAVGTYGWDLGDTPTIDVVKSHFKNLPSTFDMTEDNYTNGIFESNLSTDIAPNDFANENVEGSYGWCVIADSPVTYTFNVKAGKSYYLYNFGSKIGFYGYSFDADENIVEDDIITYKDNETNEITATAEGHVSRVSINRSFKADTWSTCVLPFSLNKQQVDAIFGTTYSIDNTDGTQILYYDRVEDGKVYFVRHAYNTIVAGKPFLIKPSKDVTSINTADVTDYPYVTIENTTPAEWCSGNGYSWVSDYRPMTVKKGDGFISGTSGKFMNYTGNDATMNGFRGYLKKDATTTAKTLSVGVSSNIEDDGETTFIDGLQIDSDGNIFAPLKNGKVYNANGQEVGDDAKDINALPGGVYIVNGKKYVK